MTFTLTLRLAGTVDREAFEAAVDEALARHPLLVALVEQLLAAAAPLGLLRRAATAAGLGRPRRAASLPARRGHRSGARAGIASLGPPGRRQGRGDRTVPSRVLRRHRRSGVSRRRFGLLCHARRRGRRPARAETVGDRAPPRSRRFGAWASPVEKTPGAASRHAQSRGSLQLPAPDALGGAPGGGAAFVASRAVFGHVPARVERGGVRAASRGRPTARRHRERSVAARHVPHDRRVERAVGKRVATRVASDLDAGEPARCRRAGHAGRQRGRHELPVAASRRLRRRRGGSWTASAARRSTSSARGGDCDSFT